LYFELVAVVGYVVALLLKTADNRRPHVMMVFFIIELDSVLALPEAGS
jgi:hypothetical protein